MEVKVRISQQRESDLFCAKKEGKQQYHNSNTGGIRLRKELVHMAIILDNAMIYITVECYGRCNYVVDGRYVCRW